MVTFRFTISTPSQQPWPKVNIASNKAVDLYLDLLERSVTGTLYNDRSINENTTVSDFKFDDRRFRGNDWPGETGHTMVGNLRIRNIKETLLDVINSNVQGDFAEFGVWRGGSCIFAAGLFEVMGITDRHVHVFDAFGKIDTGTGGYGPHDDYLAVNKTQVMYNFWKYGLLLNASVHFNKGMFQESAPQFKHYLEQNGRVLAVLRIDGNFYDSYYSVLDALYDLVSTNGYVIFDDIRSHPHVQEAWNDFQQSRGMKIQLKNIDDHSAYFKKP
jgi:hypothetical protein